VVGTSLYAIQNSTALTAITNTSLSAGIASLAMYTQGNPESYAQGSSFVAGSAAASTYSISGNAGIAGATVAYTGFASGSVTADGSGNSTISGLANGSYTITPTLSGYAFSPTSQNETIDNASITGVNFTATKTVWSQPDCRLTPNTGVTVQGTIQYTGQTSCNLIIPPTDSRKAGAPQDCRKSSPQNSRNNPTGI
jgi:hypothetical protein